MKKDNSSKFRKISFFGEKKLNDFFHVKTRKDERFEGFSVHGVGHSLVRSDEDCQEFLGNIHLRYLVRQAEKRNLPTQGGGSNFSNEFNGDTLKRFCKIVNKISPETQIIIEFDNENSG